MVISASRDVRRIGNRDGRFVCLHRDYEVKSGACRSLRRDEIAGRFSTTRALNAVRVFCNWEKYC